MDDETESAFDFQPLPHHTGDAFYSPAELNGNIQFPLQGPEYHLSAGHKQTSALSSA